MRRLLTWRRSPAALRTRPLPPSHRRPPQHHTHFTETHRSSIPRRIRRYELLKASLYPNWVFTLTSSTLLGKLIEHRPDTRHVSSHGHCSLITEGCRLPLDRARSSRPLRSYHTILPILINYLLQQPRVIKWSGLCYSVFTESFKEHQLLLGLCESIEVPRECCEVITTRQQFPVKRNFAPLSREFTKILSFKLLLSRSVWSACFQDEARKTRKYKTLRKIKRTHLQRSKLLR